MTDLDEAIRRHGKDMKPNLHSRYEVVKSYLNLVENGSMPTIKDASLAIANSRGKGDYFAFNLRKWGNAWLNERSIPETKRGAANKARSWMEDEWALLVAREHISEMSMSKTSRKYHAIWFNTL